MIRVIDQSTLLQCLSLGAFKEQCVSLDISSDAIFCHQSDSVVSASRARLQRGINLFGPGLSKAYDIFLQNIIGLSPINSFLLANSTFIPHINIIHSPTRGFLKCSIRALEFASDEEERMRSLSELLTLNREGQWDILSNADIDHCDALAIPICGYGFTNYGHFLYDGLVMAVFMLRELSSRCNLPVRLIGPPLKSWQGEILEILEVRHLYQQVSSPTNFSKIVASNLMSDNVAYPTRITRMLFEEMILRVGQPITSRSKKYFLPRRVQESNRRRLVNRDEVIAMFSEYGFEVVYPEDHSVAEQIKMFADARIIAGESGAAMANLSFCLPGAKVLELQPECFVEGWTRAMCLLFGHEWFVYFAKQVVLPPSISPGNAAHDFDYEVDASQLRCAIEALIS